VVTAGARPGRASAQLAGRAVWNTVGQLAPQAALLVLTPFILDHIGLDRYGVWALAWVVITFVTSLDGGIGASLAWFFSLHRSSRCIASVATTPPHHGSRSRRSRRSGSSAR
jgi:O-antigen/teichoic acid export membrane protein